MTAVIGWLFCQRGCQLFQCNATETLGLKVFKLVLVLLCSPYSDMNSSAFLFE